MNIKYKIFLAVCCLFLSFIKAQNLVPNSSFEDTIACPTNSGQLSKTSFWINGNQGTVDYYNTCSNQNNDIVHIPNNLFGNQNSLSGNGYCGFYAFNKFIHNSGREYLEILLSTPLILSEKYAVSFYVSPADSMQYSVNSIGAYFSNLQVSGSSTNRLNYIPQVQNKTSNPLIDKTSWILISDTLIANGGEQYMTIGNFMLDSLSDTLFLGNGKFFSNYAYYYIDSVSVIDIGSTIGIKQITNKELLVLVYPNPAKDLIHIEAKEPVEIELFNLLGNEVLSTKEKTVNVENLQNGIYFIKITSSLGQFFQQKIIVNH